MRRPWWPPLVVAVLAVSWSVPLFAEGWAFGALALGCAAGAVSAALVLQAVVVHSDRAGSPGGST